MTRNFDINREKNDHIYNIWKRRQGFCTMTLYIKFEKGCSAAW